MSAIINNLASGKALRAVIAAAPIDQLVIIGKFFLVQEIP